MNYGMYGNFNPNYANTYSPYTNMGVPSNYGMQNQAQPQAQPTQFAPQQTTPQYIHYVNGIEGAKGFLVEPNTSRVLMDSDRNYFYIKTANAQGQATVRTFKYEEVGENIPPQAPAVEYAKQEDFAKAVEALANTRRDLDEMKKQIEALTAKKTASGGK